MYCDEERATAGISYMAEDAKEALSYANSAYVACIKLLEVVKSE